jgi:hypothetical protein
MTKNDRKRVSWTENTNWGLEMGVICVVGLKTIENGSKRVKMRREASSGKK